MIEINGPKRMWFEWSNANGMNRISYHAVVLLGNDPNKLVRTMHLILSIIKHEGDNLPHEPILYWRSYPAIELNDESGLYELRMRLAIEPELPDSFWNDLDCTEKINKNITYACGDSDVTEEQQKARDEGLSRSMRIIGQQEA